MKPKCDICKSNKNVVIIKYQNQWKGYECEKCYNVVKEIYRINEITGEKIYDCLKETGQCIFEAEC